MGKIIYLTDIFCNCDQTINPRIYYTQQYLDERFLVIMFFRNLYIYFIFSRTTNMIQKLIYYVSANFQKYISYGNIAIVCQYVTLSSHRDRISIRQDYQRIISFIATIIQTLIHLSDMYVCACVSFHLHKGQKEYYEGLSV